ncbi:MAG: hypothetical protein HZA50_16515 [Planctomycetes bacterium]|nr:hypothetical protein [Planctomycetota bacterium]
MKPSTADKLMTAGCAAGLTAWCGSLIMLWSRVFDTSVRGELLRLVAFFAAVWAAFRLAGAIGRFMRAIAGRIAERIGPVHAGKTGGVFRQAIIEAAALLAASQWRWGLAQVRSMLRLLAAAMLLAVVLGILSTICIHLAGMLVDWLGRTLLWTIASWTALEFALVFLCSLPMGLGAAGVFHAALMMRCGGGRDVYAALCRDWLAGTAAGLAALGALWWAGTNMAAISIAICLPMAGVAIAIMVRRNIASRAGRYMREDSPAPVRGGWAIAVCIAALAAGLMAQLRLSGDVVGSGPTCSMIWAALSLAGLTWFIAKQDRRSAPPGAIPELGAILGLSAGGCMQAAIMLAGATAPTGAARWLCLLLAAAVQPALLHFASIIISRRRRMFDAAGGQAGRYAALAAAGLAAGCAAYLLSGWLAGWWGLVAAAILPAVAAAGLFAVRARQKKARLAWQAWGAVLVVSLAICLLASAGLGPAGSGGVARGLWLTADFKSVRPGVLPKRQDYLPAESVGRGEAVNIALHDLLAEFVPPSAAESSPSVRSADLPSRWWVITGRADDLPASLPQELNILRGLADPSAGGGLEFSPRPAGGDFFLASQLDRERFDGIIFSPLSAGHPQAWRCYNERTLRLVAGRLHRGGLLVLRLRAAGDNLGWLLAAAKTFWMVMGSGWAMADLHGGGCELLLIGPALPAAKPARMYGTYVVPVEKLWRNWDDISPILSACPPGPFTRNIASIHDLRSWLENLK